MGNYITIEVPGIKYNDRDLYENTCRVLAKGDFEYSEAAAGFLQSGRGTWQLECYP